MQGTAYTYFTTENSRSARELIKILKEANSDVPYELEEMARIGGSGSGGGGRGMCYLILIFGDTSDGIMQGGLVEVAEAEVEVEVSVPVGLVVPVVGSAGLVEVATTEAILTAGKPGSVFIVAD